MRVTTIKNDRGVTLIELLIVLVIAAILVAGVYSLFITQHRSYTVQDQVAGVQQDARAALDIMARDIRMAGSLSGGEGFSVNTHTFAITPSNGGGSTPASNPDVITVVVAADEVSTVTNVNTNTINLQNNGSTFDDDHKKYVAIEGVNHVYQIQSGGVSGNVLTLTESAPSYLDNVGAKAFLVKAITYQLSNGTLQRDDHINSVIQPLAGDGINTFVEDLQFAYQVSGVNYWTFDGIVDAAHGETIDTALPAGATNADIRMVRITLIVRTVIPDPKETGFSRPACEDRTGDNTNPGCRRRIYTTVVKVRNLT